ncbi:hypothetical protein [Rhodopirellula halodulae]|uniref:hypothetical protein n=1 Tax=Rhodopirellula halodulae TaxID=2894198 RepID=UPI001E39A422|nr:hypothetical protein [Rhodopirellula sp. JC737]MCC9654269.1 hypothetical protein [Rhodopirellula sp. JC737]
MTRSIGIFVVAPLFAAIFSVVAGSQTAQAGHNSPLYDATDRYRDAVSHFEDEARRVRTIDRDVLRLIDDFEDQTSDLRSAARHPDRTYRLAQEYNQAQFLQSQTERAVFGSRCPIIAERLSPCWNDVLSAFAFVQQQMAYVQPYVVGRPGTCGLDHGAAYGISPYRSSKPVAYPYRGSLNRTSRAPDPRDFYRGSPRNDFRRDLPTPGNYRAAIPSHPSMPEGAAIGLTLLQSFLNRR